MLFLLRLTGVGSMELPAKKNKTRTKTMKKYISRFALVACVAFCALSARSNAACLHVNLLPGKARACCVEKHRHEVRKHHAARCHHACKHARPELNRHHVARHKKSPCCHGR